jgi:hypothetical protein
MIYTQVSSQSQPKNMVGELTNVKNASQDNFDAIWRFLKNLQTQINDLRVQIDTLRRTK